MQGQDFYQSRSTGRARMQAEQEQNQFRSKNSAGAQSEQESTVDHRQSKNVSRVEAKPAKGQIQNQELNQSNNLNRVGAQACRARMQAELEQNKRRSKSRTRSPIRATI
jgi:hypothetical protein